MLIAILVVPANDLHPLVLLAEQRAQRAARRPADGVAERLGYFLEGRAEGAEARVEDFSCGEAGLGEELR